MLTDNDLKQAVFSVLSIARQALARAGIVQPVPCHFTVQEMKAEYRRVCRVTDSRPSQCRVRTARTDSAPLVRRFRF